MDSPARILVLEDNPADAELAQRELRKAGIDFVAELATDEASFVRGLQKFAPDLVLSDFSLPGFDGLSAMALARERVRDIPVIIVSGAIGEETAIEVMKAGATDYVLKTRLGRLGPVAKRALDEARHLREKHQADEELACQRKTLQRSEEQLRLLLEGIQDYAIFMLSVDGRIMNWAPGAQRVLHWRAEEVINQPLTILYTPEDIANGTAQAVLEHTIRDGHCEVEGYRLRKDGSTFWAHVDVTAIRDTNGQPLGLVAVVRDMTERKHAEEALQRALALAESRGAVLDALMEHVPEGITIVDAATMQIQMVSRHGEQLLGGPPVVGMSVEAYANQWRTYHADGITPMAYRDRPMVRAAEHGETVQNAEIIVTTAGGRPVPLLCNAAPIRDAAGRVTGGVVVSRDITDLKQAEDLLRNSERHARQIIDNMLAFVGVMDLDGTMRDINASALQVGGLGRQDVVGKKLWDTYWWSYDPQVQQRLREAAARAAAGEVERYDVVVRLGRGGSMDIDFMLAPVRNEAGAITHLIPSAIDITQRKQVEAKLRLQAAALEAAANGMAITDAQGTILWANPAFSKLTGYPPEELIGQNHRILKSGQQDEAFYRDLWQTISQGHVWRGELINRRRDGTLYTEEQTITPVPAEAGPPNYFIAVKQDISARKLVEQALTVAKTSAEEASQAKDHFLAVLSHELRTPLTPVTTALAILESDRRLPEDVRDELAMIERNVELETRLIDDLLDLTRISRGKITLDRRPLAICTVLEQVAGICTPDAQARDIHFGLDLRDRPVIVEADAARVHQVFWNILKNAIKFTPAGGCIGVRMWREDGHAIAEVADSGRGIDPELLPRIFNAFEQGSREVTKQFGGLGLGLAICKALVDLHGGTITAHSRGIGQGATFRVRFPVTQLTTPRPARPSATNPLGDTTTGPRPGEAPLRVLLVEDHGDTARVMKRFLATQGYRVTTAGDVASALEIAHEGEFDVLVSDLGLPDGSGLDIIQEIRKGGSPVPAIALSGYGQEEDIRRSREAGFNEHLVKPVDIRRLDETIGRVIREGRSLNPDL